MMEAYQIYYGIIYFFYFLFPLILLAGNIGVLIFIKNQKREAWNTLLYKESLGIGLLLILVKFFVPLSLKEIFTTFFQVFYLYNKSFHFLPLIGLLLSVISIYFPVTNIKKANIGITFLIIAFYNFPMVSNLSKSMILHPEDLLTYSLPTHKIFSVLLYLFLIVWSLILIRKFIETVKNDWIIVFRKLAAQKKKKRKEFKLIMDTKIDINKAIEIYAEKFAQYKRFFLGYSIRKRFTTNNIIKGKYEEVFLSEDTLAKSILVIESFKNRKRSFVITPLLTQVILNNYGALAFDFNNDNILALSLKSKTEKVGKNFYYFNLSKSEGNQIDSFNPFLGLDFNSALEILELVLNKEILSSNRKLKSYLRAMLMIIFELKEKYHLDVRYNFKDIESLLLRIDEVTLKLSEIIKERDTNSYTLLKDIGKKEKMEILALTSGMESFTDKEELNSYDPTILLRDIIDRGDVVCFNLKDRINSDYEGKIYKILITNLLSSIYHRNESSEYFYIMLNKIDRLNSTDLSKLLELQGKTKIPLIMTAEGLSDLETMDTSSKDKILEKATTKIIFNCENSKDAKFWMKHIEESDCEEKEFIKEDMFVKLNSQNTSDGANALILRKNQPVEIAQYYYTEEVDFENNQIKQNQKSDINEKEYLKVCDIIDNYQKIYDLFLAINSGKKWKIQEEEKTFDIDLSKVSISSLIADIVNKKSLDKYCEDDNSGTNTVKDNYENIIGMEL